ncbi:MAG TPA: hypothetical protein VMU80_12510 [Bryobacteraceae bacterium]|nr:hypothetical protein [Bryobacteraceae bacterium]HUO30034.1 hypothetical protein [Bryobacteraceae bacterium]
MIPCTGVSFLTAKTVLFVLVTAAVLSTAASAQQSGSQPEKTGKLLLESTAPCSLKIDGEDKGRVVPDNPISFGLEAGDHIVSATSDEKQTIRKVINIKEGTQAALVLEFPRISAAERAKDFLGTWFTHQEWQTKETCRKPNTFMGAYVSKGKMVPCEWSHQEDTTIAISSEPSQDQVVAKFSILGAEAHNNVNEAYRPDYSLEYSVPLAFRQDRLEALSRFDWDDPEKAQLLTLRIEHSPDGRLAIYQSWTPKGKEPVEPTKALFVVRK